MKSQFIFVYHGGGKMPETKEEGQQLMAKWNQWVADLGERMIEPGKPAGKSYTVSADGVADNGGANPIMGFSIVEADSIEAATDIAKTSPHLEIGTIEVAKLMDM